MEYMVKERKVTRKILNFAVSKSLIISLNSQYNSAVFQLSQVALYIIENKNDDKLP